MRVSDDVEKSLFVNWMHMVRSDRERNYAIFSKKNIKRWIIFLTLKCFPKHGAKKREKHVQRKYWSIE
jgi:hypothetical protein